MIHTKRLAVEVKDAGAGLVEAVFSTYGVVDHDGDVTMPGAFRNGQEVRISAWNHGSWSGALPVGKGVIEDRGDRAVLVGQFFLDTASGAEHFAVVKGLGSLQEWSYGFNVTRYSHGDHEGQEVRFLEDLDVTEVAPVLKGAGIGTHTLLVKSAGQEPLSIEIPPGIDPDAVSAWITKALEQETGEAEAPDEGAEAERKRRDTDLLRLVAATQNIPTGGSS